MDRWVGGTLTALVPTAGLDAVLVSVELALESAPPSGRVSVEHVVNVMSRLNAAPKPENAATTLQVTIPPLADTARYDTLRAQGDIGSGTGTGTAEDARNDAQETDHA